MQQIVQHLVSKDVPLTALPPGDPTYDGFVWFVDNMMQVPVDAMPNDATLQIAYDMSLNLAYCKLQCVPSQPTSPSIYAFAVYNLGAAMLLEFAQDNPLSTFWNDLRNKLGINAFLYGLIDSAHDQGTSEGMFVLNQLKGMTLFDLQLAKSPWGRAYLMFAGEWGAIWGLTI